MRNPRAIFSSHLAGAAPRTAILVVDYDEGVSVTNDAEAVVDHCLAKYGNHPIYYRDTDYRWDELRHDGHEFVGFGPLSDETKKEFNLT